MVSLSTIKISAWKGIVMGGGVSISCLSPIRICKDKSVFAMPESKKGFFTDIGASYFLPRINDNFSLGLYLVVTGRSNKGDDLLSEGLVTHNIKPIKIANLEEYNKEKVPKNNSFEEIQDKV